MTKKEFIDKWKYRTLYDGVSYIITDCGKELDADFELMLWRRQDIFKIQNMDSKQLLIEINNQPLTVYVPTGETDIDKIQSKVKEWDDEKSYWGLDIAVEKQTGYFISETAWKEIQKKLNELNCKCHCEIKTGQTSVMCCNVCGKPDEDFWGKGINENFNLLRHKEQLKFSFLKGIKFLANDIDLGSKINKIIAEEFYSRTFKVFNHNNCLPCKNMYPHEIVCKYI